MGEKVQDSVEMNHRIHQAVRRDLRRFGSALGAFTAGDRNRATALADLSGRFAPEQPWRDEEPGRMERQLTIVVVPWTR